MPNFLKSILRAPAGDGPDGGGSGVDTDNDIYGADVDDADDAPLPGDNEPTDDKPKATDEPPVPASPVAAKPNAAPAAAPVTAAPAAPVVAAPAIDPKVIEEAVRKFVPAAPAAPAAPKALKDKDWSELTDEEFNVRSKRPMVDAQTLHDIGIPDASPEQIGKFQGLVDSIASHAIELSVAEYERAFKAAEAKYEPMFKEYQKYQNQEVENKFYGAHSDLAELRKTVPKFDDLVAVTARSVSPTHPNGTPKTYDEVTNEIANNVRSIFKSIAPNGVQTSPATTPAPGAAPSQVPVPANMPHPGRSSRATQGTPAVTAANDNGSSIY